MSCRGYTKSNYWYECKLCFIHRQIEWIELGEGIESTKAKSREKLRETLRKLWLLKREMLSSIAIKVPTLAACFSIPMVLTSRFHITVLSSLLLTATETKIACLPGLIAGISYMPCLITSFTRLYRKRLLLTYHPSGAPRVTLWVKKRPQGNICSWMRFSTMRRCQYWAPKL